MLYKIAQMHGILLPEPRIHVYIAGILDRANRETPPQLVVNSWGELTEVIERHSHDSQPHAVPFLVARASGDFYANYNAVLNSGSPDGIIVYSPEGSERGAYFPAYCYDIASFLRAKMGKAEESRILRQLAMNLETYVELMAKYHRHLREDPNFVITEEDHLAFKKFITKKKKVVSPVLQQNKSDTLLI